MSKHVGTALLLLGALGCSDTHTFHAPDVDLPPPGLGQISAWRNEEYRKDPKQVAHVELIGHLDVPFKLEPFHADTYTFIERNPERPDWGSYVTRGYVDRNGNQRRYRVKVRQHDGVWYAIQLSRFIDVEMQHPALDDGHHH